MKTPRPGSSVRGSRTGRPIMALLDLLGRRSCLRVLWELRMGSLSFRALEAAADTNPSVLNSRLGELRAAGIVVHDGNGYSLTAEGRELIEALSPLSRWAEGWAEREVR